MTRAELLAAGITDDEIRARKDRGSLLPVFPGLYRVGHAAPSIEADYIAAVKAGGDGAVLSGLAAAYLWDLIHGAPPPAEVTARTERRIEGVRTRRCRDLGRRDCTEWRGIPVTSIARTLVDLAAVLSEEELARVRSIVRASAIGRRPRTSRRCLHGGRARRELEPFVASFVATRHCS